MPNGEERRPREIPEHDLREMELNDYLKKQRCHIAIIGKFTKKTRTIQTNYRNAHKKLERKLYAVPETKHINENDWFTLKLVTAAQLGEEDREKENVEVELGGVLDEALMSGKPCPAIGGELFVNLLNALDDLAPFTHPSFDKLLTETFVEFTQLSSGRETNTYTVSPVRETIEAPGVRERFLAYLRSDPARRDPARRGSYFKSFRQAALEACGSNDQAKWLSDMVQRFARELSDERGETIKKIDGPNRNDNLKELIKREYPPRHAPDETASVVAHLRHLFGEFHKARGAVERVVNCEPILALMISWLTTKFGQGQGAGVASTNIWDKFYAEAQGGFTDEQLIALKEQFGETLQREGERILEELQERLGDSGEIENWDAIEKVIDRLKEKAIQGRGYDRRQVFSAKDLIAALRRMHDDLMVAVVPGMTETLAKLENELAGMKRVFAKYEGKRAQKDLTVKALRAIYDEVSMDSPKLAKCMTKMLEEEGQTRTGQELTEWFDSRVGILEATALSSLFREFLVGKAVEINQVLKQASTLYGRGLEDVYAGGKGHDGVSQAPPGGSVSRTAAQRAPENDESEEDREVARRDSATLLGGEQLTVQATQDGGEATERNALNRSPEEFSVKEQDIRPEPQEEDGPTGADREGSTTWADPVGSKDELLTLKPEQAEAASEGIDEIRGQLVKELMSKERKDLDSERALFRAVLLGEMALAADPDRSPLDIAHRSLHIHFILRMVEKLGAGPTEDRERFREEEVTEIDWKKLGADEEFLTLPFREMLQLGPGDWQTLENFVTGWNNQADEIVSGVPKAIEDFREVKTLVDALAASGKDGGVTIIDDTLRGHAKKAVGDNGDPMPSEHKLIASSIQNGVGPTPPGIVYVSPLAFANEENENEESENEENELHGVSEALFNAEGPLFFVEQNERTLIQDRQMPFADGAWGMPVFVGRKIKPEDVGPVPTISITDERGVSLAEAVLWLASVSNGPLGRKVDSELNGFVREIAGGGVGSSETREKAWNKLLTINDAMAAQVTSRVCSLAMLVRVRDENPRQAGLVFADLLDLALQDLDNTQEAIRDRLQELRNAEQIRIGRRQGDGGRIGIALPDPIQVFYGPDAEPHLVIGQCVTKIIEIFPRI